METQVHDKPDAKILERIRRLLAMAKDASSPNEAAIAARRAQVMMEKYNIEESETILEDLKTAEAIENADIGASMNSSKQMGTVPGWAQDLSISVARMFDCHVVIANSVLYGTCLRFVGYKTDVVVARWVFEYLLKQIRKLNHNFLVSNGRPGRAVSASYRQGVIVALKQGLREAREAKEAAARQGAPGTALVVAKADAIEKFMGHKATYGTKKPKPTADAAAYSMGYYDGRKVNVNPNVLNGAAGPATPKLK